ncbi:MAG: hypothetical protein HYV07_19310 [Deltaproteobacteria bacterium]|nr:hypothetical protein [Deltaproteobacteria bacterium]
MSNLRAIGFSASSRDDFLRAVDSAFERAEPAPNLGACASKYLWFRDSSGAALAARVESRKRIQCLTPFFDAPDGGTRWRVRTTSAYLDRECVHCSGADCDVLDPSSGEMCTRTALQFLFFEPYRSWLGEARTFDAIVVGFASTLTLCSTPDDLERAQAAFFGEREPDAPLELGKPMRLADQAFLPHGMFGSEGTLGARARALLAGTVEGVASIRNELTGTQFLHARVRTLPGSIDIVAPANALEIPEHPTLALAECWLVARPVDEPPPKTRFLHRFLG